MPNLTLTNTAAAQGVYLGENLTPQTDAAIVFLVEDVVMTLTAAKLRWADNYANTYTATITVTGDDDFEPPVSGSIEFSTDAFDSAVVIHEPSVAVTGNTAGTIAVTAGVLSVELTDAITSATPTVITFDVYKAGTEPTP